MVLKGREQGFEKRVMRQKILYLARVDVTEPKEVLKIGFFVSLPFSQNLVPFLLTPSLPPLPISHQLSR